MTYTLPITGIDIRKELLAAGMNPNKVNEKALQDHLNTSGAQQIEAENITAAAEYFIRGEETTQKGEYNE